MSNTGPSQQCGNNYRPDADRSNAGAMAQQLMSKLAAANQDCNTSSFAMAIAGEYNGPLGLAGGKVAGSTSKTDVSGCQALQSVVANYLNSVYNARCIIQNTDSKVGLDVINRVEFKAVARDGGIVYPPVDCPGGPRIIQRASTVLKDYASLKTETQSQIADKVAQNLNTTLAQLQNISTGFGATPQGSASLSTLQQKVTTQSMMQSLSNSSKSVQKRIEQIASADFSAIGPGSVNYQPCLVDQNSILDLQLAEIISDAYATAMSGEIAQVMASSISSTTKISNEGAPSALDMFKSPWGAIGGIIGAIVLAIIVVMVVKSGALKKAAGAAAGAAGGKGGAGGLGGELGGAGGLGGELGDMAKMAFRYRFRY